MDRRIKRYLLYLLLVSSGVVLGHHLDRAIGKFLALTNTVKTENLSTKRNDILIEGYHSYIDQYSYNISKNYQTDVRTIEDLMLSLGAPTDFEDYYVSSFNVALLESNDSFCLKRVRGKVTTSGIGDHGIPFDGLLAIPERPRGLIVAIHGTASSPEQLFEIESGYEDSRNYHHSLGLRLVRDNWAVYAPRIVSQTSLTPTGSFNEYRNQIDKRAMAIGMRILGIELLTLSKSIRKIRVAVTDLHDLELGVYGISLGGALAFYLAALEHDFDAIVISNWLEPRSNKLLSRSHPTSLWRYEDSDYAILERNALDLQDVDVWSNFIYPRPMFIEVGSEDNRSEFSKDLLLQMEDKIDTKNVTLGIEEGGHEIFYENANLFLKSIIE